MADVYAQLRYEIDSRMNITVHGRSGLSVPLRWPGRDVAAAPMFIEIEGIKRKALGAGGASDERTLLLTREEVAAIHAASPTTHAARYIVLDESGAVPDTLWDAEIKVVGFVGAPPV